MRHDFRRSGNAISFFAFQDIITSVIGIILFIALLLALFIGAGGEAGDSAEVRQAATLEMIQELNDLIASIADAEEKLHLAKASSATISEGEVEALKGEIALLESQISAVRPAGVSEGGSPEVQQDLTKMEAAIQALEKRFADAEENLRSSRKAVADLQAQLEAAQQEKLAEEARRNEILLIPGRAQSTKSPLLLDVREGALIVQRLDGQKKESAGSSARDLKRLLADFPPRTYYVVVFFRPSTFHLWPEISRGLRSSGYEIGYDLLRNDQTIALGQPDSP